MNRSTENLFKKSINCRATDYLKELEKGSMSAEELLRETYRKIESINPKINAICTLLPLDEVINQARAIDRKRIQGQRLPPLSGLPMAVKDLALTKDIKTTMGSPLFADHTPKEDCLLVERLRANGAILIGKTNTPEFGAGSHTFNTLFGVTRNPYDLARSAGGSSGGAAAALASGMLALADGSDMGGSLRNPATFCNVVGMRPSFGRVPCWPDSSGNITQMSVDGPMARTVEDCALLLEILAGPDARDPSALDEKFYCDGKDLQSSVRDLKLGWAPKPASLPVEGDVLHALESSIETLSELCFSIVEIELSELIDSMAIFSTLRAATYASLYGSLYRASPEAFKPALATNIYIGLNTSQSEIELAERNRIRIMGSLNNLFADFDYLILPVTQVSPFIVETEFPQKVDGQKMSNYYEWMSSCCILSPFGLPCISVPGGFTDEGLPTGLQIVGKRGDDKGVLTLAYAFQQATQHWKSQDNLKVALHNSRNSTERSADGNLIPVR